MFFVVFIFCSRQVWVFIFGLRHGFDVHFLPTSAENEPKERRTGGRGFVRKKADEPHFCALQHSPPCESPSCCLKWERTTL